MTLLHAAAMLVLFLVLLVLELFIPSGGLLGIAAAAALVAAIIIGFTHSLSAGASILVVAAALLPIIISIGIRAWPRTPIGRRMLTIDNPQENDAREAELRSQREAIVGKIGIAKTDLLPSGLVEIEGARLDAISIGIAINRGEVIEVVSVTSGKIRVRPYQEQAGKSGPAVPSSLETPIESLGDDWG
jgi:membrane-bound ClpP family serine protease